ncbi:MAG: chemotaxis protein CheW [Verrucomicrobiota bacterium]
MSTASPHPESSQENLLHRPAPAGYLENWNRSLAEMQDEAVENTTSLLIFRLFDEWLAFSTQAFAEVIETRPVHRVPHRSNDILHGVTNVRGTLILCFSLSRLLQVEPSEGKDRTLSRRVYNRFIVMKQEKRRWVFPCTEIFGVHQLPDDELEEAPVTVAISRQPFTKSIFRFRGNTVGLLDHELLYYKLDKDVL